MSWVGGDIPGLQAAGGTLSGAPGKTEPLISGIGKDVDSIIGSANWTGEAATKMRERWGTISDDIATVGTFTSAIGDTLTNLGSGLADTESSLYASADSCQRRGAQIDMSNGRPLTLVIVGDQTSSAAQDAINAQDEYKAAYDYAMQAARSLRLVAAAEIESLVEPVVHEPKGPQPDADKATMASILRGLWTARHQASQIGIDQLNKQRDKATKGFDDASGQLEQDMDEFAKNGGPKLPPQLLQHATDFDSAYSKLQTVAKDVDAKIPELESRAGLPGSTLLNTKIEDIAKAMPTGELPAKLRLFNDIPVLDVLASSAMAGYQVKEDVSKGANLPTAIAEDGGAAGGGLLGGAAVAEAVADAVPGPGWAVGAGIVVAVGLGDGIYQGFHEHWTEDVHDHGVIAGIGAGLANTGSREWDDMAAMGKQVGSTVSSAAESVWHGVFG